MSLDLRRVRFGALALLVLASCFHGPKPAATLAPNGPDGPAQRTSGPFAVVYGAPKGRVIDRAQPGVTLLFSRAVRDIETADDEKLPAVTIKTKSGAAVPGAWRWTGTRGLLFSPDGELPGGNDFVVTVPENVRALDGTVLGKPYTLSLDTAGPLLASFKVLGPLGITEKAMPSDVSFRLQFDQSVEPNAVAEAAILRTFKADGDRGERIRVIPSRPTTPATPPATPAAPAAGKPNAKAPPPAPAHQVPDSYVVILKPEKPLPLDQQVELSLAGLRGTGGPRPMGEPVTHSMRTHGPLRFVDFYCPRIEAKGRCRQNGDVKVVLSNPVSPEELKTHVKLGKLPPRPPPKPGAKAPPRRIDPAVDHWLGVAPMLGEKYDVVLTAGMKDIYGQKLEKDASFELIVEAPLVAPAGAPAPAAPPAGSTKPPPPKPHQPAVAAHDTRPRRERLP
jgi:hypothetical protein